MVEKARILIVDDDESICRSMKVIFEAKNYDTEIAHSGQEAIAATKKRSFNVAILDIRLPDVDGITLLEQLSEMNVDLGIIMITGYASVETAVDALNKDAAAYITKPLNMDEVLITVDKALEKQQLTRAKLRAEAALQEERDRAQKYLDIAGVMIVSLDLDGTVTLVNRRGCEILGYDHNEVIGKDWFKTFLPKRFRKETYDLFRSLTKGKVGPMGYSENLVLTKNGEERIIAWYYTVLTNESGMITGTLSSGEDITERKRANEQLRVSEEKHKRLFETSQDGIAYTDQNGLFIDANQGFLNIVGYDREELLSKTYLDITPEKWTSAEGEITKTQIRVRGYSDEYEKEYICKDGTVVPVSIRAWLTKDDENRPLHTIAVVRDITERKRAEEALKTSQQLVKRTFDSLSEAVLVLEAGTGEIMDCNPATETVFDYSRHKLLGQKIGMLHIDEAMYEELVKNLYLAIEEKGFLDRFEHRMKRRDGTAFPTEHSVTPLKNEQGTRIGWVSVIRDITERKLAKEALRKSEERYRSVFENLLVGFLRIRIDDSRIVFCNEVTAHMFGYDTPEEAIDDYLPAEHYVDPEFSARAMQQFREAGEKQNFLTEIKKRNGERIWVEIAATMREKEGYFDAVMVDVTERRKAEEEIKYLASLVDKVSDAIISTDNNFMIRSWNSGAERTYGWNAEEAIGKRLIDFLQTETIDVPAGSSMKQLLKVGRWSGEALQTRKDGSTVQVIISASLLVDEDGTPTGAVVVNADITDRVHAEKALKDSEERMTALFKGIPVPTYIWKKTSDDFILSDYNNAAEELTNGEVAKVVGAKLSEFHSDRPDLQKAVSKVYNEKNTLEQEIEQTFKYCGEHKHLNVKYSYVPPDMVLVHTEDITEKKQAEAALQFERERYISVLAILEDGIYVVDRNYDVEYTNLVIEREFGQVAGRKCYTYLNDRKEPCPWCKNDEVFAGNTVRWEWHSEKNDRYYDLLATPMENADGSISKFEILRDITERKSAEDAIKQSEERYKELYDAVRVGLLTTRVTDGKIVGCNAHFVEMFGFESREQAIAEGISLERYVNPDERQQIISELKKIGTFKGELALTKVDGIPIWVEVSSHIDLEGGTIQSTFMDITERRSGAEALLESEKKYRLLAENTFDCVWQMDLNTEFTYINPAVLQVFGFTPEEWIGSSLSEHCSPEAMELMSDIMMESIKKGSNATPVTFETRMLQKDSKEIDVEIFAGFMLDKDENPVGFQGTTRNITERKRAKEALQESEEWFRTIYEESPIAINVFDLDGNLIHANPALLNLVGVSSVEDLKNFNIFRDPNMPEGGIQRMRENERARYQSVIDFAKVKEAGLYDTSKSGVRYVDVRISPLKYGEDESLSGYMIQMVDITDRVLAEKAVEKRVKELTCLLGTSQLASKSELALDAFLKGVVKLLPPAWFHAEIACARILLDGLVFITSNFKETKWKGVTDITVGKERRGAIEIYYLEQKPELDEGPFLKEERALIDSIAELVGNAVGRWQAEEELRELTEELEQRVRKRTQDLAASNQELEAFAYSISHDLRSPLRGIAGFSMAVIEDYSDVLDETGRDYLRRMHDATVRMSELIDDILSLSRVSREEMHSEEIDMTALARTITEDLRSQEPKRKANLVISNNLEAYGDKRLLCLVLENLLGNAWKFTNKQRSATIELGATEQENETVFFVRDNGAGFDMKYVDKLFNVFQRLHHADEFEGTGIGLAIVKRIISRHGGRTWAEGDVGTGATFYFALPSKGSEVLT